MERLRFGEDNQLNEDIERTYVDSSNIKSIWFELKGRVPGQGVLYIEFLSDAVYEYHRVPEWVAELFMQAPSFGRYMWRRFVALLIGNSKVINPFNCWEFPC